MKKNILILILCIANNFANAQWVQQTSGTVDNFWSVFFPTPTTGYITDINTGHLLKTTNGGANWNTIGTSGPTIGNMYFTSVDTGYACGVGGILKTIDGGLNWTNNFPCANLYGNNIHFPTKNIGYVVAQNAAMDSIFTYKTINAGNSWALVSAFQFYSPATSIFFTDAMTGSMVVEITGIYQTIDGGVTWVPKLTTSSAYYLIALTFPSNTVGYAVGGDSIFKTTDAGTTWNPIYLPNSFPYYSVFFTDIDTGYAAGGDGFSTGVIRKTVDGGLTWTLSNTNPYTFQSIHFPNSSTGYACGQSGIIYKYGASSDINENKEIRGVLAYPNPNTGKFKLSIDQLNSNLSYKISVLDVLGNKIQQTEMNKQLLDINISDQSKGIYFIKIENGTGVVMKKIIYQ